MIFFLKFLKINFLLLPLTLLACAEQAKEQDLAPAPSNNETTTELDFAPPQLGAQGLLAGNSLEIKGLVSRPAGQDLAGIQVTALNTRNQERRLSSVNPQNGYFTSIPLSVLAGDLILLQAQDPLRKQFSPILQSLVPNTSALLAFEQSLEQDTDQDGTSDQAEWLQGTKPWLHERAAGGILKLLLED